MLSDLLIVAAGGQFKRKKDGKEGEGEVRGGEGKEEEKKGE